MLAGEISPYYPEIRELLKGELGEGVVVTGYLSLPDLLALMETTDVAFNLRSPTGGETSGVCVRLLGLGTPVIVNEGGWFSEIPDGCCARVSVGATEEDELVAVLEVLAATLPCGRRWAAPPRCGRHARAALRRRWTATRQCLSGPSMRDRVQDQPCTSSPRRQTGGPRPGWCATLAAAAAGLGVRDDDERCCRTLSTPWPSSAWQTSHSTITRSRRPTTAGSSRRRRGPDLGTGWRKRLRGFVWRFVGRSSSGKRRSTPPWWTLLTVTPRLHVSRNRQLTA